MRILWLLALPFLLFGQVIVSIPPQKYIVDRISGGEVEVEVLLPRAASPLTYQITPKQLGAIKKARLYLTIGVPFEHTNMERIKSANPDLPATDMSRYVAKLAMGEHHDHHEGHHHRHDPHTWLSPPHLMLLSRAALQDLIRLFPQKKERFMQNYHKLIADLAALDGEIYAQELDKKFVVYHPSFGYFAAVYDLEQIPIEREGKEPSAKELAALVKAAKGARVLITEPQFPQRSALFLAKRLGLRVVTIDPLAYDIPQTLRSLAKALGRE